MASTNKSIVSAKNAMLIKKWDKRIKLTESTIGKMSIEKKVALASSLQNTADRLRVCENTQPGGIGQYKRYALDIVEFAT